MSNERVTDLREVEPGGTVQSDKEELEAIRADIGVIVERLDKLIASDKNE